MEETLGAVKPKLCRRKLWHQYSKVEADQHSKGEVALETSPPSSQDFFQAAKAAPQYTANLSAAGARSCEKRQQLCALCRQPPKHQRGAVASSLLLQEILVCRELLLPGFEEGSHVVSQGRQAILLLFRFSLILASLGKGQVLSEELFFSSSKHCFWAWTCFCRKGFISLASGKAAIFPSKVSQLCNSAAMLPRLLLHFFWLSL